MIDYTAMLGLVIISWALVYADIKTTKKGLSLGLRESNKRALKHGRLTTFGSMTFIFVTLLIDSQYKLFDLDLGLASIMWVIAQLSLVIHNWKLIRERLKLNAKKPYLR